MKKVGLFILAILYLGLSSGIAMEIHYCMGKQAGIEFFAGKADRCGKCGMKNKSRGCCSNKQHFVKLNDFHKTADAQKELLAPLLLIALPVYQGEWLTNSLINQLVATNPCNAPPPLQQHRRISQLYCIFRL